MLVDGYVRVSQVGARGGDSFISPSVQREQIEAWGQLHGARVVRVFEELDESGARRDRPLLQQAIGRVEAGVSDGIVVAKLDRFGRSLVDGLGAIERITQAGGTFVSVQDGLDLTTDTGRLVLRIMLSMAEWELDRARSNWAVAQARAVARGISLGRPPTGYRRGEDGRLVVDPLLGPAVSELFRRRAAGQTITELRDFLIEKGLPTQSGRRYWSLSTVTRLLQSRAHLGEIRFGPYVKSDAHEPLIDAATWERAQRPALRPPTRRGQRPALLHGLVRCASCRRVMRAYLLPGTGETSYGQYACRTDWGLGPCPRPPFIGAAVIEPYVEAIFWQELARRPLSPSRRELSEMETRAKELERGVANYRDNVQLQRRLGEARFSAGVSARMDRLESALLEVHAARARLTTPEIQSVDQLRARWGDLSVEQRRGLLAEVIDCVFVFRGRGSAQRRLFVCLRGNAPTDLGDANRGGEIRPLDPRRCPRPPHLSAAHRKRWPEQRLRRELGSFLEGRDRWPSFIEFQSAGKALLYRQVRLHGGAAHWAGAFALAWDAYPARARSWTDDQIRAALIGFVADRATWPSYREFRQAGLRQLREAISHAGGAERWSAECGLELSGPQRRRGPNWTPQRIDAALRELTDGRDDWPPQRVFVEAGLGGLHATILRRGERLLWARRLGLKANQGRLVGTFKWSDAEIEAALRKVTAGRSTFPRQADFKAAGRFDLYLAARKSELGLRGWASRLGLPPDGRWTDETIERELRRFLNGYTAWPSAATFRNAGEANLYMAAWRHGGLDKWARRLGLEPRVSRTWTREATQVELRKFLRGRRSWPTAAEFQAAGLGGLYNAMCRSDRRPADWAQRLDLPLAKPLWTDERIERELRRFLRSRTIWPTVTEFRNRGPTGLYSAIVRHGGAAAWAQRVGVRHRPKPRWTEEAIEAVLGPLIAGQTHWPTYTEFESAGLAHAYKAIARSAGGHDAWAKRLQMPRGTRRQSALR